MSSEPTPRAGPRWRAATPDEAATRVTRLGGAPSWSGPPRWPHFQERPLEFLGQIVLDAAAVLLFMSFEDDTQSWLAEGGGNAAIVDPAGEIPDWVSERPLTDGPIALGNLALVPEAPLSLGGRPRWLQRDQTPVGAPVFVTELASFPDPLGMITFGDGGVAYLFVSPNRSRARMLWQTI
jgi:hypothetical protein